MRKYSNMRYSNKSKKNLPVIFSLLLAICLVSVGIIWLLGFKAAPSPNIEPILKKTSSKVSSADDQKAVGGDVSEQPSSKEVKPPQTARLVGVGDDLIHSGVYLQARRRAGGTGYDFNFTYENVAKRIGEADIATVNQETPMAPGMEISGYPMFNAPTQVAEQMAKIGFDVMNMANNHILDAGTKGLNSTLEFLRTQPLKYVGVYLNKADYDDIRTMTSNEIVFSFLGATQMTNGLSLAKSSEAVISMLGDEAALKAQIEKARTISDVVVVNVHWGEEYTHVPNKFQKETAQKLCDWGADIIIGHHPHVIQPVEYLTRADGSHAVVAYSLGNFISTQEFGPRMLGGMIDVSVKKDFQANKTVIEKVKFVPIVTHYDWGYANAHNYFLEDYTKELAAAHGCNERSKHFSLDYLYKTVKDVVDEQFLEDFVKNYKVK